MTQPVWVLSVDLQTKTATFQSGMADAAKSARGAFTEIKSGSGEMGREVGGNMMEARHGVMLLGEEFGIHLPRALSTFIASIGPIGAAMEAAFPFLAIAVGATLLIEALVHMHEAGEKLTADQVKFGTAVQSAFNQLDDKLLQAQIRADELRNDHLGALHHQLELIDRQSMGELVKSFEEVAKAADVVFGDIKSHWYTFGIGATGAKHAMDDFQAHYDAMLAQGKDKDASDLLKGTKESAERILAMQKQAQANSGTVTSAPKDGADVSLAWAATNELKKAGVGFSEKETAAQQALVDALNAQLHIEQQVSDLKKLEGANATRSTANAGASEASAAAREAAEAQLRMGSLAVAADKAAADARLQVQRASIAARLANEVEFADRELQVQLAGNAAQIAALDKLSKDYPNQLKAMHDKALELTAQHDAQVSEMTSKASVEQANHDLAVLEASERAKIEATTKGTADRLAAINAAIHQEEAAGLADTNYYRDLLTQRAEAVRQEAEEEAKVKDAAIKQSMAAADKAVQEQNRHSAAMNKIEKPKSADDSAAKAAELNQEYAAKHAELMKELADTQSMGVAKVAAQQRINAELEELDKEHQDRMKESAAAQVQSEKAAAMETANAWAQGFLRVAQGHESMSKMAQGAFESMISNSLKAALMEVAHEKTAQLAHAEAAAAASWHAMSGIPGIGPVLGAAAAAATFAGAMAFQEGGVVPGTGTGDIVPAMLEPGEGVIPKSLMESMKNGNAGAPANHYTVNAPIHMNASALDADGVDEIFEKHASKIQKHFENTLRKMNR